MNICEYCMNASEKYTNKSICKNYLESPQKTGECANWAFPIIMRAPETYAKQIINTQLKVGDQQYLTYLLEYFLSIYTQYRFYRLTYESGVLAIDNLNKDYFINQFFTENLKKETNTKFGTKFEFKTGFNQSREISGILNKDAKIFFWIDDDLYLIVKYKVGIFKLTIYGIKIDRDSFVLSKKEYEDMIIK